MNKGILFDVDGTLLDSMKIWEELPNRYLNSIGISSDPDLASIVYPMTLEESSSYLKKRYQIKSSSKHIQESILSLLQTFYEEEVELKEGVLFYLQEFKKAQIPMGIVSIGKTDLIEVAFKRLGIDTFFDFILTCDMYQTNKKESLIYEIGKEKLKCDTVYVFEDVLQAIQSAKRANCRTVAIEDDSNKQDQAELKKFADFYLEEYSKENTIFKNILE